MIVKETNGSDKKTSFFDRILDATGVIVGGILILMTLNICVSVFGRYFFNQPLAPLFEWTEYGVLAIPLLAAALLSRGREHIHLDLLDQLVPDRVIKYMDVFVAVIVFIIAAFLTWAGLAATWSDLHTLTKTNTFLGLLRWPFIALITLGFLLLLLQQARTILRMARGQEPFDTPEPELGETF